MYPWGNQTSGKVQFSTFFQYCMERYEEEMYVRLNNLIRVIKLHPALSVYASQHSYGSLCPESSTV